MKFYDSNGKIKHFTSNKCLYTENTDNGKKILLGNCNNTNSNFTFNSVGSIKDYTSNKCINV
jgi:hypothetical protein